MFDHPFPTFASFFFLSGVKLKVAHINSTLYARISQQ